ARRKFPLDDNGPPLGTFYTSVLPYIEVEQWGTESSSQAFPRLASAACQLRSAIHEEPSVKTGALPEERWRLGDGRPGRGRDRTTPAGNGCCWGVNEGWDLGSYLQ